MWEENDLVFPNEFGGFMRSEKVRDVLHALLRQSGLPDVRFHDLRHSAATDWLKHGMHQKVASERLGHASVAITLDLYSHVTATMQREAVDAITRSGDEPPGRVDRAHILRFPRAGFSLGRSGGGSGRRRDAFLITSGSPRGLSRVRARASFKRARVFLRGHNSASLTSSAGHGIPSG